MLDHTELIEKQALQALDDRFLLHTSSIICILANVNDHSLTETTPFILIGNNNNQETTAAARSPNAFFGAKEKRVLCIHGKVRWREVRVS
jgi:hypothetical protein